MTFEQYRDLRKKGYSQSQLQGLNQENKPKSFFSKLGEALKTRASNFADTSRSVNAGQITSPEATLRGAGQIAGAVSDVAGIALGSAAKTAFRALPQQGQENIRSIGTGIAKSRPGQAIMSGMQTGAEAYGGFKQNNPRLATNLEAVGNVASVIPVGFGGKVAGKEGINIAKDVAGLTKRIGKSNIDDVIETGISKGIRPSVVGKNSLSQMNQYKTKAKEAVLNIVKNKNNLSYVDEFGESVTGKLPSSLKELTEAVDQTKKRIFNEYSALATKAGGTGVAVDLNKVTSELGKIVNDKVIQTISPETAQYASNLIERFSKQGSFTPEQAQQAIANLNESLQSFYKNPTYGTYRQAQIDALITNNLRESLDEVITSATGPGYAELKKAYGALKTIEKDAIKRAVVEGRKNVKGLVDFTDIFSAGDVVMGVATGNPAQVAKGAIQKAVSSYIKRLNSPDNAIKQMFKKVEGAIEKGKSSSAPFVPKSMTGKGLRSLKGKGGLNLQTVGGGKAGYSDPLLQEASKYKSAEEFSGIKSIQNIINDAGVESETVGEGAFKVSSHAKVKNELETKYSSFGRGYKVKQKSTPTGNLIIEDERRGALSPEHLDSIENVLKERGIPYVREGKLKLKLSKSQLTELWKKAQGETKRGFGTGAGRPKTITKAQDSKITKSSLQEVLQDGAREYIKRLENAKTIDFDAIAKYQDLIKRAPKITDIQSLTRNIAELERKSKLKLMDEAIKIRNEVFDGLRKKNLKK